MKNLAHLTHEEMVRLIDGELDAIAQARVETHLANCAECLKRYEDLAEFSGALNHAIETVLVPVPAAARPRLEAAMEQRASIPALRPIPWWQWAAMAAGLALVFLLLGQMRTRQPERDFQETHAKMEPAPTVPAAPAPITAKKPSVARAKHALPTAARPVNDDSTFENAFIRLPYSDPSLPVNTADIVRVEIPLSALASSGVVRTQPGTADTLVKADVLLGLDGQPSAIRLVSARMITN
jgi:hypothetical protein